MAWFKRDKAAISSEGVRHSRVPEGMWEVCVSCREIVYRKELERNFQVCPKCGFHCRLTPRQRIRLLADEGTFRPRDEGVVTNDPLGFRDTKKYTDRIRAAVDRGESREAIVCGEATLGGRPVLLGIFDFRFMGGSMGSVVGEKLSRSMERAAESETPLVTVTCSGGARMQEGLFSLMQMAKTSASLVLMEERRVPYISILSDPTTGGVSASFAMLGDVIIAEPGALVGFAGPRVIEQTIGEKLPEGFQRAEFLLDHGLVDMVVKRTELKETVGKLIDFFAG